MKYALAQMDVLAGQPEKNVQTMLDMIAQAKANQATVIIFPEMAVGGYLLGDRWLDTDYCYYLQEFNDILRKASKDITIIYGNIYVDEGKNKDGRPRKYNAVYSFTNQQPTPRTQKTLLPAGIQPKTLLPNYRFFDDERYFFSLQDVAKDKNVSLSQLTIPFIINNKKVAIQICEDLWVEDYRANGKPINPSKLAIENGAQFIINISASPWTHGKNHARDRRIEFLKQDCKSFTPFIYVNCVGAQNNGKNIVTFDGASTVYNSQAQIINTVQEPYKQTILYTDLNEKPIRRAQKSKIAEKHAAIIRGLKHLQELQQKPLKWIIGLSGGIDSAVVATLLTQTFGKENVHAVNMPSVYNSTQTKSAAKQVAQNLGITYTEIPIQELVNQQAKILQVADLDNKSKQLSTLNKENIQAKIRGTSILSNLAGKYNALFTNNGNKLEIALGYATLYGDVSGAIAPIADLTKAEVFELARYLNKTHPTIPTALIPNENYEFQLPPTAELKENQVDPMLFGYHDALLEKLTDYNKASPELLLKHYLNGTLHTYLDIPQALLNKYGLTNPSVFIEDLEHFIKQINGQVFKRIQAPPIIITSKSAYGYDIRESQLPTTFSKRYQKLKKEVLVR